MTGTVKTERREFRKIYKKKISVIPTNRPVIRQDLPDRIFAPVVASAVVVSSVNPTAVAPSGVAALPKGEPAPRKARAPKTAPAAEPAPEAVAMESMRETLRNGGPQVETTTARDFFPTPAPLADRLVELAGIKPGAVVLEPSAGGGNIVAAVLEAGAVRSDPSIARVTVVVLPAVAIVCSMSPTVRDVGVTTSGFEGSRPINSNNSTNA